MDKVRQPGYQFEESTVTSEDIDWSQLSEVEMEQQVQKLIEANSKNSRELARAAK